MIIAFWTRGTFEGTPPAEADRDAGEIPGPAGDDAGLLAAPVATAEVAAAPVEALGAEAPITPTLQRFTAR